MTSIPFGVPTSPMPNAVQHAPSITLWLPEQDQIRLAVLGKLAEECSELAARSARCIIQGIHERDPVTGRDNHTELAREIADVQACIEIAGEVLETRPNGMRHIDKADGFRRWHDLINAHAARSTTNV